MRNIVIFFVAMLITSTAVMAQAPAKPDFAKILPAYAMALKSDNAGLRDSAAYQIAIIKSEYPDVDFTVIERVLNKVAKSDQSSLVRIHASLTLTYLQDAKLAQKVKPENPENSLEFYNKLHSELFSSFFTVL
jgi:hypothetical protein